MQIYENSLTHFNDKVGTRSNIMNLNICQYFLVLTTVIPLLSAELDYYPRFLRHKI